MCPSIQSRLHERICESCGVYFASQKGVQAHKKTVHKKFPSSAIRVHPVQVLMRKVSEVLCIVLNDDDNADAEWIDVEDVENADISPVTDTGMPRIKNLDGWLTSPWMS